MRLILIGLLMTLITLSLRAQTATVQSLQQQHRLEVKAWVEPDNQIAVKQQVLLIIEVATDRWFTGGTRIGHIDLDNALVLKRNKLATNFTERKQGETWSHQRWEITVYPQSSGTYIIPPTSVKVQVATDDSGNVSGTLLTRPVQFEARLPSAHLTTDSSWIASSSLTLSQTWNQEPDISLVVGDAIVRTLTLEGTDTTAMQFPPLPAAPQPNARIYDSPPLVKDTQSRGDYSAVRSEEYTYMVVGPGRLAIPPVSVQWWDTKNQRLQTLTVPGGSWVVKHTPTSFLQAYWIVICIGVVACIAFIYGLFRIAKHCRNQGLPVSIQYYLAVIKGNTAKVNSLLYRKLYRRHQTFRLDSYRRDTKWRSRIEFWRCQFANAENRQCNNRSAFLWLWRNIAREGRRRPGYSIPKAIPALTEAGLQADRTKSMGCINKKS